jgi:preprotein translocase SecE subunit
MAAVTKSNDGKDAMPDEEEPAEPQTAPVLSGTPPKGPKVPATNAPKPGPAGRSFFTIYKKGQGYWTRMGTAVGAGFLGVMVAFELYQQIPTYINSDPKGDPTHDKHVALVVALIFLAAYSLWAFWFTNKPRTVDFLVATDSEMKKVNWTTRKELIGSTKIVILFMFMIATYLFTCDLVFGGFFKLIHVAKTWF